MSKTYRIAWEIDIEAESPEQAIEIAKSDYLNHPNCQVFSASIGPDTIITLDTGNGEYIK